MAKEALSNLANYFKIDDIRKVSFIQELKKGFNTCSLSIPAKRYVKPSLMGYGEAMDATMLTKAGINMRFLIMDKTKQLIGTPKEEVEKNTETLEKTISIAAKMLSEEEPMIEFHKESHILPIENLYSNFIRIASLMKIDQLRDVQQISPTSELTFDFLDAAVIATLPEEISVDGIVMSEHEVIAKYIIEETLPRLGYEVMVFGSPMTYYKDMYGIWPYVDHPDSITLVDDDQAIRKKILALNDPFDVEHVVRGFVQKFIPDNKAKEYLKDDVYKKYKDIKKGGRSDTDAKKVMYEYLSRFNKEFMELYEYEPEIHGGASMINADDKKMVELAEALANQYRALIFTALQEKEMSPGDILTMLKNKTGNKKLTLAHIHPHTKKLLDVGLIERVDGRYKAVYSDLRLYLRK